MQVVAACVPDADDASLVSDAGIAVAGDIEHVVASVREFGVDAVAVTAGTPDGYLRRLAWSLEGTQVELLVDPGLVEVAGPRLHIRPFVGMPLLHVEQPTFSGWKRVFKAVADVTIAVLALIALLPVWIGVALAIKVEDRGPIFFRQERVGKDGRTFKMWKFRSMVVDAEAKLAALEAQSDGNGVLFKLKRDPRITRVGAFIRRYSIDELPQLFNVLNRSMSLVGPRPPLQREVELYAKSDHRRLLVQPGLTGLWQISGRSNLTWEESIRLDLRYVETWSFTGDLLIMWKTLFAVIGRRGAY
jgi:exopolysaccharide biosynthesis polyprenyl glycosylphosphotransferase